MTPAIQDVVTKSIIMWQIWMQRARAAFLGCLAMVLCFAGSTAAPADPVTAKVASPLQDLDDPVQPLVPKQARTEEDRDRLEAASMFAAGRALEERQDFAGALKRYERALRCDPEALPILREIIPLGFTLNRQSEAVRYALKLAELDPSDPMLLLQLGRYVTEDGDMPRAIALYEKALTLQDKDGKAPGTKVKLQMELGRLCFLAKDYAKAADAFAKVNEALEHPKDAGLDPVAQKEMIGDGGLAYELFGETFLESNRLPEARAAFEKMNKLAPNDAALAFDVARVLDKENHPADALDKLQVYFDAKESSRGTGPYELLAKLLKDQKQENEVDARLEAMRKADPDNLSLAYVLARRYQDAEKFDEARAIFEPLLAKKPSVELFQALTQIAHKKKEPKKLFDLLTTAIGKVGTLEALGSARKELVEDEPTVQAVFDVARAKYKADPDEFDVEMRLAAGMLALEAKQFDAAREFLDLALQKEPKNPNGVFLAWGLELFMAEKFADAAAIFQRGIDAQTTDAKSDSEDSSAFYFYLAGALEMSGKTDEALVAAKKAAELRPKSVRFQSRTPWINYHAKRYDEAMKGYLELVAKYDSDYDSDETRDSLREARLTLSNLYVLKNDTAQGEEWLEQVLDEFPDDVGAHNDLGYLWADQSKHLERALRMLKAAVAADPKNVAYRDSLGWCLYRLGKPDDALVELKIAVEGDPDPVILDHLGDVQAELNNKDEAREAYGRAVEGFDKQGETEKKKATQEKLDKLTKQ